MDRSPRSYGLAALALVIVLAGVAMWIISDSWWWLLLCIPGAALAVVVNRARRQDGLRDIGR